MESETKANEILLLQNIFNEIQVCDSKRFSENLRCVISKCDQSMSLEIILCVIYPILMCKKTILPSKMVLFLKLLFEELSHRENVRSLLIDLIKHLVSLTESKMTRIRRNSIFILHLISTYVEQEFDKNILEKLAERLFDKQKSVRKKAVTMLSKFQNFDLNRTTKICNLFKNLTRYDTNHEVRKLAFGSLDVNILTYNCILERMTDKNLAIRLIFYKKFIEKIDIKELDKDSKINLLRQSFCEREIDGLEYLCNACSLYYDLPNEFPLLVYDFYNSKYLDILQKFVFRLFNKFEVNFKCENILVDDFYKNIFFNYLYLKYVEDTKGREEILLPPLSIFTEFIYSFIKTADIESNLNYTKILFKIFGFYDVFDSESKKIISSSVYKILHDRIRIPEDILDELVHLIYTIDRTSGDKMFGKMIYKNLESELSYSLKICKYILKYANSIDMIQNAIIDEIAVKYFGKNEEIDSMLAEIFFYFLLLENNKKITNLFFQIKKSDLFFCLIVDLAIFYKDQRYIDEACDFLGESIDKENYRIIIPGSKLFIHKLVEDYSVKLKYVCFALKCYYEEVDIKIQQYMAVFIHEYFTDKLELLSDSFCIVYESLTKNGKFFANQILYLLNRSEDQYFIQNLFYKICIHISNFSNETKQVVNLVNVLNSIELTREWDLILTKKILFCCTQLLKKKFMKKRIKEIIDKLIEIDDGNLISQEDLICVKRDLLIFD